MKASIGWRRFSPLLAVVLLSLGGIFYLACEKEQKDEVDEHFDQNPYGSRERDAEGVEIPFVIPANATVTFVGQELVFWVDGGIPPFEWSVADDNVGDVEENSERDAVYTADTLGPNVIIAVDRDGRTASGAINQTLLPLRINPSGTQNIPAGGGAAGTGNFTASGGLSPYDWGQFRSAFATLTESGANNELCAYETSASTGTNTLFVTDRLGDSTQVNIIQL